MTCERCESEMVVMLNADFVCDCTLRAVERYASPAVIRTLSRAIAFQRAEYPLCDRCDAVDADGLTRCYLGCTHAQCLDCATQTNTERRAGLRWDARRRNGLGAGAPPPQPLHQPGPVDDPRELAQRLA